MENPNTEEKIPGKDLGNHGIPYIWRGMTVIEGKRGYTAYLSISAILYSHTVTVEYRVKIFR
jgi:hypothetical protein